jgi:hypothetical protein
MNTREIWMLPKEERLHAFIARWEEIAAYTGCHTLQEKDEMFEIAMAIMPHLLRERREQVPHG